MSPAAAGDGFIVGDDIRRQLGQNALCRRLAKPSEAIWQRRVGCGVGGVFIKSVGGCQPGGQRGEFLIALHRANAADNASG